MKKRITELTARIKKLDAAYYGQGISLVQDHDYDLLYNELLTLEKKYKNLAHPGSPTSKIGNDLSDEFVKVKHSIQMMSIDNTYSSKELTSWIERTHKTLDNQDHISFICELKMDGVACAVRYNKGSLEQAVTRGNGAIGDDITRNVRMIRSLPLHVKYKEPFEIRGEIYMRFDAFNKLNIRLVESGQKAMQNPRNTAAGTIKRLNREEVENRQLDFAAHFLISQNHTDTHEKNMQFLEEQEIPTVQRSNKIYSAEKITNFIEKWDKKKKTLPYPVDGIVIKLNNIKNHAYLGATAKSPRWVIAYKYKPEVAQTELLAIDAQVGRTGVITPVARLKSVLLSGTTVSNATLHNYDEIMRLGIGIGDIVEIEKSGEIIPKILRLIAKKESTENVYSLIPTNCPSCNTKLIRLKDEVALRCINTRCKAQLLASLKHFVSRAAMDIDSFGPVLLEQLIDKNLISNIADIYAISTTDLIKLERMGEKSASNIIKAVETSKENPLYKLIHGLGIKMIGSQTAKILSKAVNDILELGTMDEKKLTQIDTIGPNSAQSIITWFSQTDNLKLIQQLKQYGLNCKGELLTQTTDRKQLSDRTYVITGTLATMRRNEVKSKLETLGAKVSSSVSKKTTALIAGDNPGSKISKAETLGVQILSETDLKQLLNE